VKEPPPPYDEDLHSEMEEGSRDNLMVDENLRNEFEEEDNEEEEEDEEEEDDDDDDAEKESDDIELSY